MFRVKNINRKMLVKRLLWSVVGLGVLITGFYTYKLSATVTVKDSRELVRQVCVPGGKQITNAAKYEPSGYNYFAIGKEGIGAEDGSRFQYSESPVRLSDPLVLRYYDRSDVERISLVACIDRVSEKETSQTCSYEKVTLTVYSADYTLSVYEARSGKLIIRESLAPYTEYPCNFIELYDPAKKRVYTEYSEKSISSIMHKVLYK